MDMASAGKGGMEKVKKYERREKEKEAERKN
jgi:hypothetical protein